MKQDNELEEVVNMLSLLGEDFTVPKNVREKVREIIDALSADGDNSLKINKALNILEDIADDVNVQSYTRTQILNVVSLLEKINFS